MLALPKTFQLLKSPVSKLKFRGLSGDRELNGISVELDIDIEVFSRKVKCRSRIYMFVESERSVVTLKLGNLDLFV
jgi:hypothetical protein